MSTAHRQMDPARRAAGKKPDATAPGNARIVPRLFTSELGGGLSAWAHAIRGDSETRLHRLLLGTRKIPFAVDIRFNTVSPGIIKTPMHDKANHAALAKFHPLARMGEISDIVDAVLYLQKATFVTGENIRVDGGVHAGR